MFNFLLKPMVSGLAAGASQLAVGEFVASLSPRIKSPIHGITKLIIDTAPVFMVDSSVALLQEKDKPLIKALVTFGALSSTTIGLRHCGKAKIGKAIVLANGAFAVFSIIRRPHQDVFPSSIGAIVGALAGASALKFACSKPSPVGVLTLFFITAVSGILTKYNAKDLQVAQERRRCKVKLPVPDKILPPPAADTSFDIPGLSPLITPNKDFYITDVNLSPPMVYVEKWRIHIFGMVESERTLDLNDLFKLPLQELDATLVCIHNPIGGSRLGTARWTVLNLMDLLKSAGIKPGAKNLIIKSIDGFTAKIPLEVLKSYPAMIAVGMNGETLSLRHGFPARVLIPGIYGQEANVKWLSGLELAPEHSAPDYWGRRGWPAIPSAVKPGSRIDTPKHYQIVPEGSLLVAGMAWFPPHGIQRVEVSVDHGPWKEVKLSAELAPTAWRQWFFNWNATAGEHSIRVRAHGRMDSQPMEEKPPFPEGASGIHEISVLVGDRNTPIGFDFFRPMAAEQKRRLKLAAMGIEAWFKKSK